MLARSSTGNRLDPHPRAAVDDRAQAARGCEIEDARDSALVDQIGLLGQRRRGQHAARLAVREPGGELGRRGHAARTRYAGARRARRRGRRATSAASPAASARSSTKARSCAAASATAQVVVPIPPPAPSKAMWSSSSCERRRSGNVEAARRRERLAQRRPCRAVARRRRLRRSRAPAAAALSEPSGATSSDARVRPAGTLAAHDVAGGRESTSRPPAGCRRQPHARRPAMRSRAGPRARSATRCRARRLRPSSASRTITGPARAGAGARRARAGRWSSASATAAGARSVTETPPERSLAGERSSRARAATRDPLGPITTTSTKRPRCSRRVSGADPEDSSSATARSPRRSASVAGMQRAAHEEVAAGEADERPTTGQRVESAEHRGRAVGRGDRHGDDVGRSRTIAPAATGCRSASTAVAGAPPPGTSPSASAISASARPRRGQPVLAQSRRARRSGSRERRSRRSERQAQREARPALRARRRR